MIPWHSCRLVLAYSAAAPVRVATVSRGSVRGVFAGRVDLLRGWAEGDRRRVARVVDGESGGDVLPSDVDWTGLPGGEPQRRAGRPETGRAAQTLVRSTEEQRAAWQAAAEREGLTIGVWAAAALDAAAGRTK